MPLISVAGNCDYGSSGPREALETFEEALAPETEAAMNAGET